MTSNMRRQGYSAKRGLQIGNWDTVGWKCGANTFPFCFKRVGFSGIKLTIMSAKSSDTGFFVWDNDLTAHGPVELPMLVSWVKVGRVKAGTWVFVNRCAVWERAADLPELQL